MAKISVFKAIFIALLSSLLMSCSWFVPEHQFTGQIETSKDVNPNHNGRPSPVVVIIYQLKGEKIFENAEFFSLYQNGKQVLSEDYVSQREIEMIPDRTMSLDFPIAADTKYIGVIAAFSDIENTRWRAIVPLDDAWGTEAFTIKLDKKGVSVSG